MLMNFGTAIIKMCSNLTGMLMAWWQITVVGTFLSLIILCYNVTVLEYLTLCRCPSYANHYGASLSVYKSQICVVYLMQLLCLQMWQMHLLFGRYGDDLLSPTWLNNIQECLCSLKFIVSVNDLIAIARLSCYIYNVCLLHLFWANINWWLFI